MEREEDETGAFARRAIIGFLESLDNSDSQKCAKKMRACSQENSSQKYEHKIYGRD